ncbi:DUF2267 domain-containing protein [Microbispora sp. H10836]|uniref:DUF2267 domain-containing protein n=1 Tax=Microbispora sp. H10836 TaxID=2729106 RepID=UPI001473F756|nr:DUF2267 domain-containing protein [Microbispora sp. H10836]
MDYEEFLEIVSRQTGLDAEAAQRFDVDEFLRRVAEREQVDVEEAERHARAVFWALGGALDAKEVADLLADLPEEFDPLVAEAQRRHVEVMRSSEFLSRVASRTGLDAEGAERATAAVLETLAERVAAGEVRDLIREPPVRLYPPLGRGIAGRSGTATRMGPEESLRRVAEREGASLDQAREHAAAVFAKLRESITDKEFFDITVPPPPCAWSPAQVRRCGGRHAGTAASGTARAAGCRRSPWTCETFRNGRGRHCTSRWSPRRGTTSRLRGTAASSR